MIDSLFCGSLFNIFVIMILQRLLQGYIKETGIYCHCCNSVVKILICSNLLIFFFFEYLISRV